RSSVFSRIAKPWFKEEPNSAGEWGENRTDADMAFWKNCEESGINVQMAMDVVIGHMELVCTWPHVTAENLTFRSHYQSMDAWRKAGQVKPPEAFDRAKVAEWANAGMIQGAVVNGLELKG